MEELSSRTLNLDFDIGAQVDCGDESCGKLTRVVIDPDSLHVVALVVERGLLSKDARVIPLRLLAEASPDTIRLTVEKDALDNFPEYDETEFSVPAEGWEHQRYHSGEVAFWAPHYLPFIAQPVMPMLRQTIREGISSTQEVIGAGLSVRDQQGDFGTVERVLTHRDSGAITHLVVKSDKFLDNDVRILPIELVSEIDDLGVITDLQGREFGDLPEYRPR